MSFTILTQERLTRNAVKLYNKIYNFFKFSEIEIIQIAFLNFLAVLKIKKVAQSGFRFSEKL
jgi:hypothetical protein